MNFEKTEAFIKEKIKELDFPYFKCVVTKDNKIIYSFRHSNKNDSNDLLRMYSMSKPITTVALMQLVNKGLVKLNDKVSKYLDGFENLKLLSNKKVKKPIKIHHLLTMTSGLDYNLSRPSVMQYKDQHKEASTIELASTFAKDGLCFEPGSNFQYSLSIDVIAAIIEKVTGIKFSKYVEENIFKPLGMHSSTFENNKKLSKEALDEYQFDGSKIEIREPFYDGFMINDVYESGGAGLLSNVDDYSLFASSLANNETLLKKSLINKINKVYVKETPFNEQVQEYSKSSAEYGYGYGVRVRKVKSENGIPKGEFGWDGAAGSYSLIDRKNKISIVVGLTICGWPTYVKDFHIKLVNLIYKEILKNSE